MKVEYVNNPYHPVTVLVIGAGGNGSQLLTQLGRIDHALKSLGKPGLFVTLMDGDKVSESNRGRQLFTQQDVGEYKSAVLISRINRFWGTNWKAIPEHFTGGKLQTTQYPNIVITCTDKVDSRLKVHKWINKYKGDQYGHEYRFHYWLDLGNTRNTGQVILGSPAYALPTVCDMYPKMKQMEDKDDTPSCSQAEALAKQDLFINTFISDTAAKLLWEMTTQTEVDWRGAFINLITLNFKKIAA